jgi:KDO2-lipid IV(A) lauroyltransferase
MPKPRSDVLDRLQYIGLRLAAMTVHSWPISLDLHLADLVGSIMYRLDRKHRDRATGNLHRSFPEMPPAKVERLAEQSMQHMCRLAVETVSTTRLIHIDTFAQHIEFVNFTETLDLMLRKNQGLIVLTGHFGNWEILGYVLATLGFPTTSIARPLDNQYMSHWLFDVRERTGQRIIAKKGAVEEVTTVLEQKGVVGFIADQNAGSKGMFVDFFGRKASTYKSIGLLAMQYEVPVIIGFARRSGKPFHFKVGAQDIIHPQDWKDQDDPLRYITQRYTKAIEDMVRKDPAQYLWVHRRWKSRPRGETPEQYD